MKVKRLKMTSFRGISNLTLDFPTDEPTVFIGINGVGKSSILDCLSILLSRFTGQMQASVDSSRSFNQQDITNGQNETYTNITISLNDSQEVNWFLFKRRKNDNAYISNQISSKSTVGQFLKAIIKLKDQVESVDKNASLYLQLAIEKLVDYIEANSEFPNELPTVVEELRRRLEANAHANLPLAVCYPVNRVVFDIPLEITEEHQFEQIDAYEHALTGGRIDFRRFFEWFRNREDLENEWRRNNPGYRDRELEAVREAIYSLLGEEEFSNLQVERSPLQMIITKQGQELSVNQLSDGEKGLLAMVGDLARRLAIANPSLPDPLQGSGVVLIDEIELHLHPKWQREIIPALTRTFPNCQFIVTTHSPQVISQVKPESIYILERTDSGIVARRPESSFGRDSNRILEDLMGVPARPQEIKENLLELFRLIDKGDLNGAKQLRQQIANEIGADEPELVKAGVSIRRKEILGK
ncbi:MAG TPA: AAA family ATPase [Allocoleopsis sp.]